MLCRAASPAQQAQLLALASQQGLLYSYQLPDAAAVNSRVPADEPRNWNLLCKALAGQVAQLEPVRAAPIAVVDDALDDAQRYAVGVALATPDVCLIQGLSGTGKSRVVAEIVTQAAQRGDRVLLVAAHTAALDGVCGQIARRESLCPIRCVAPGERLEQMAAPIRAFTYQERAAAIRNDALRTARETRETAELQCARRRHQEPLWPRLAELAETMNGTRLELAQLEVKLASIATEVASEAKAGTGRLARESQALRRTGDEQLAKLAGELSAAQRENERLAATLGDIDRQIAAVEPLASAKARGQWWTLTWWKATFNGDVVGQLAGLRAHKQETQSAIELSAKQLQEFAAARLALEETTAANLQTCLQSEISSRQHKLCAVINQKQADLERHESLWADLCRQIEPTALHPSACTSEAVKAAQETWQQHRQDDETRCVFAREWAALLETSSEAVATRLLGFANLVAATPAALAADAHFSDPAAVGGQFDLLVVEEADQLAESDFLKLARRARQWVLVGEPPLPGILSHADSPHQANSKPGGLVRGQFFHQLWSILHCDISALPHSWFHEGQRLGCRLRHVAVDQRQWLECEPLADAPDVELRILALPQARPELAEVLFPENMQLPTAKGFLFRELQEITVQTSSRGLRWSETPQSLELHFTRTPTGAGAVTLDDGVREYLMGPNLDHTSKLEFERAAGWDRNAVERWVDQHLEVRDLGRTVWLDEQYRLAPNLAEVVFDILGGDGGGGHAAWNEGVEPAVQFIPVLGSPKHKGNGRNNGRGGRKADAGPGHLPTTGAGLETDLAGVRPQDRLSAELRTMVPGRGVVNLPEARAIVRKLEELVRHPREACGVAPTFAVVALYPAQVELIRTLIQQSPQLAAQAATIALGVPADFRQGEADVVLVSLTRSHSHRAVAYGDGQPAWPLALTRAHRRLILCGDPGNLVRRGQWRGSLDHQDESAANREAQWIGQIVRYLHGQGRHQRAFRLGEGEHT